MLLGWVALQELLCAVLFGCSLVLPQAAAPWGEQNWVQHCLHKLTVGAVQAGKRLKTQAVAAPVERAIKEVLGHSEAVPNATQFTEQIVEDEKKYALSSLECCVSTYLLACKPAVVGVCGR